VAASKYLSCIFLPRFVATVALESWRAQLAAGLPVAGFLAAYFLFMAHESPRWLLLQGRSAAAVLVLSALRQEPPPSSPPPPVDLDPELSSGVTEPLPPPHIAAEVHAIMRGLEVAVPTKNTPSVAARLRGTLRQLAVPHVTKALAMGVGLSAVQQLSGVQVTNYFAQDVYRLAGFSDSEAKTQAIYIGVVKVLAVLVALALIDRLGRKRLLVGGLLGMAAAVAALGVVFRSFLRRGERGGDTTSASYSTAGLLVFFMAAFEIGAGPVVWVLLSEMFPLRVKGPAMSIATTANWLFNFITGLFFPVLRAAFGISGVFFMFSAVAAAAATWVAACVPETKGLQLEQVEAVFRRGIPWCSFRPPGLSKRPLEPADSLGESWEQQEALLLPSSGGDAASDV